MENRARELQCDRSQYEDRASLYDVFMPFQVHIAYSGGVNECSMYSEKHKIVMKFQEFGAES